MRISMFMPSLGPDALGWKVHLDFAAAVNRRGHEFRLLTTPRPGTETAPGAETMAGVDGVSARGADSGSDVAAGRAVDRAVEVLEEPHAWRRFAAPARPLLRTRILLPAAGALAKHLKEHGAAIDLLHIEVAYPHGAAAALAVARTGWPGPVVVTPMGEDFLTVRDRSYGMRRYPAPAALVSWSLRRAAALRCISPMAERRIAKISPDNPRRTIPLNISDEAAAAAAMDGNERTRYRQTARAALDEEFGTAGKPVVLSFGRLHPFKGIDFLVDAAAKIGDATVLVVGPTMNVRPFGDVATLLERQASRLGVADKVKIAGSVHPSRALEVLAAADLVVVPSPLESLNKVCMEAAAVGTPFAVTETTGIADYVPDEGVGIVVPPRNTAALAWAIDEVLEGHFCPDAARQAEFASQFTPDRIAAQVLDFYEQLLNRA